MRVVPVSTCLDRRLQLLGFDVLDLLAVFLVLSVLNLLFGQTTLRVPLVWIPTAVLALVLRYGKRGKPDRYLIHWLRFQLRPGVLSAFEEPTSTAPLPLRQGRTE